MERVDVGREAWRQLRSWVELDVPGGCGILLDHPESFEQRATPSRIGIERIAPIDDQVLDDPALAGLDIDALGRAGEEKGRAIAVEHKIPCVVDRQMRTVIEHPVL